MTLFKQLYIGLMIGSLTIFLKGLYVGQHVVSDGQQKVVKIAVEVKTSEGKTGSFIGSGSLVSPDGLILTCGHLFSRDGKIVVKTTSGQTYIARLVRLDHNVDLAILKIDAIKPLPYFQLGHDPFVGQKVIAFGSPLDIQGTVTFGYVENLDLGPQKFTLHGCQINPGNSGGPLVDEDGFLVGVNVQILLMNPFQVAQGLGLAVNMPTIRSFVRI